MPLELKPPQGAELIESGTGVRLRGAAPQLIEFASNLRAVSALHTGDSAILQEWLLVVSDSPISRKRTVAMPHHAWRVCASKFLEVATGREESPFDFGSCGYLAPAPRPDIGVELTGEPLPDTSSTESR